MSCKIDTIINSAAASIATEAISDQSKAPKPTPDNNISRSLIGLAEFDIVGGVTYCSAIGTLSYCAPLYAALGSYLFNKNYFKDE